VEVPLFRFFAHTRYARITRQVVKTSRENGLKKPEAARSKNDAILTLFLAVL
jgi:hypothetical protein